MANFLDRYSTDKDAEEAGVWVDFGDGIEVQLRRLNSNKSKEIRRKLEKPYAKQFRGQDMPETIQEDLLNKQIAKAIIVDWKGVPDPAKPESPLACSEEAVLDMIRKFPDFRDEILQASMERATFQKEDQKAAEGN